MTAAMSMRPSTGPRGHRWWSIALSLSVHVLVVALLLSLGRFSPAPVDLGILPVVVEIIPAPSAPTLKAKAEIMPAVAPLSRQTAGKIKAFKTPGIVKEVLAPRPEANLEAKFEAKPHWTILVPLPLLKPGPPISNMAGAGPPAEATRAAGISNAASAETVAAAKMLPEGRETAGAKARTAPRPLAGNPIPGYPARARRRGWHGRVVLRLKVASDGRVADVAIAKSSGYAVLDRAAARTLQHWRFETRAYGAGGKIIAEVVAPVVFRLAVGTGEPVVDTIFAQR